MSKMTFLAVTLWVGFAACCFAEATIAADRPVPDLGVGADLNGALPLSPDSLWNTRVDHWPKLEDSAKIIQRLGPGSSLVPEFGGGRYHGALIGIPYVVVPEDQPTVPIELTPYHEEADPGSPAYSYPIPADAPIEGEGSIPADGDRHVLIVQRSQRSSNGLGRLFELFRAFPPDKRVGRLQWQAYGAIFDLASGDCQRPKDWTSADAAGLPIFPGLVRYDEVSRAVRSAGRSGVVPHAIRFTLDPSHTARSYIPPAQHAAGPGDGPAPFGMRVRLRADWAPPAGSDWTPELSVIVKTLKTYGMLLADNGGNWFITGAPDDRWNNRELRGLRQIRGADFEIVKSPSPPCCYCRR